MSLAFIFVRGCQRFGGYQLEGMAGLVFGWYAGDCQKIYSRPSLVSPTMVYEQLAHTSSSLRSKEIGGHEKNPTRSANRSK